MQCEQNWSEPLNHGCELALLNENPHGRKKKTQHHPVTTPYHGVVMTQALAHIQKFLEILKTIKNKSTKTTSHNKPFGFTSETDLLQRQNNHIRWASDMKNTSKSQCLDELGVNAIFTVQSLSVF